MTQKCVFYLFISFFFLNIIFVFGEDKASFRFLDTSVLSKRSLNFLDYHFPDSTIVRIYFDGDYVVTLTTGMVVSFDEEGYLQSVSANGDPVTVTTFMHYRINDYLKENHRLAIMYHFAVTLTGYEIRLNNKIKLLFDKKYNIIEDRQINVR